jgi:bifunctional non-homologous end joining protein LigD
MEDAFAVLSEEDRKLLRRSRFPTWVDPMKATLTHDRFSDPDWIYEPKFDGERCLAFVRDGAVRLMSRNQKRIDHSYPEIAKALAGAPDVVIDGEVVALAGEVPSFSLLQRRMHVLDPKPSLLKSVPVLFSIFDIVYLDGYDVTSVPLLARKKLLAKSLSFRKPLRKVAHRIGEGERYYEEMCAQPGQEGLIAKRADSQYRSARSKDWLKFKCSLEQEFVIGGYTDPQGSRSGFGALLVGYYEDGSLRYAGKVGTGFGNELLARLTTELEKRERSDPPFTDRGIARRNAHWVKPDLVCQVGFSEWTGDGRLRHPRFLGLRRDKDAKAVIREP